MQGPSDPHARRTGLPRQCPRFARGRSQRHAVDPGHGPSHRVSRSRRRPPAHAAAARTRSPRGPGDRSSVRRGMTLDPSSQASGPWRRLLPRRRRPSPRVTAAPSAPALSAARPAATAGMSASSIVFSPAEAFPSDWMPPIAASRPATRAPRLLVRSGNEAMAPPARISAVPYSGPAAPPTVLINVRPAAPEPRRTHSELALRHREVHHRGCATIAAKPRSMFGPVVAVADGLIEGGQRRGLIVQPGRGEAQPRVDDVDHAIPYLPLACYSGGV